MALTSSNKSKTRNRFRIIAGQWRGRFLNFAEVEAIRPTADRVRETLFNWLQNEIVGSHCLDVFAGSGALSFEALSRGAATVTSIEHSRQACDFIKKNASLLSANNLQLIQSDALKWLKDNTIQKSFNIIFLDPPFAEELLSECCELLEAQAWLKPNAFIYLESNTNLENLSLPANWELIKHKKAGQVHFATCRRN